MGDEHNLDDEDLLNEEEFAEFLAEHTSEFVFPLLDADRNMPRAFAIEWTGEDADVRLHCGCEVPITYGDTLWGINPDGVVMYIAIDPVTLH